MYQQVHGTVMGSPISVVIANLVMEDVEQRALATFHSPLCFWKRCVDDTFTVLPRNLVQEFLSHLNSIEACIQFMFEKETEDRKLPFLDVCLCREPDGSVTTSVYGKPTRASPYPPRYGYYAIAEGRVWSDSTGFRDLCRNVCRPIRLQDEVFAVNEHL